MVRIGRRTTAAAAVAALTAVLLAYAVELPYVEPLAVPVLFVLPGTALLQPVLSRYKDRSFDAVELALVGLVLSVAWWLLVGLITFSLGRGSSVVVAATAFLVVLSLPFVDDLHLTANLSARDLRVLAALSVAVSLFVVIPHLLNPRVTISYHGFFHASIVNNVVNGQIPPSNPSFAWNGIRAYWPFHLLVGVLSEWTGLNPLQVVVSINVVAINGVVVLVADLAARTFRRTDVVPVRVVAPVVAVFGMNLLMPVFLLTDPVEPAAALLTGNGFQYGALQSRVPLDGLKKTVFLAKFLNQSGFPFGVLLFTALLSLFVGVQDDGTNRIRTGVFVVGAVVLFHVHTTTALFCFVALGGYSAASFVVAGSTPERVSAVTRSARLWGPVAIGCVPFFVYLSTVGTFDGTLQPGFWIQNLVENLFAFLVLLPVAFLVSQRLWREGSVPGRVLATAIVALIGLPLVVELPDGNTYKGLFLLSIPVSVLAAGGFADLARNRRRLGLGALTVVLLLALVNPMLFIMHGDHTSQSWTGHDDYRFEGQELQLNGMSEANDLFAWLRTETPTDSAVVFSRTARSRVVPRGTVYGISAMSHRSLFYANRYSSYVSYERAPERRTVRDGLFQCPSDAAVPESLVVGPLYAVGVDRSTDSGAGGQACEPVAALRSSSAWTPVTRFGDFVVLRYGGESAA